MINRKLSIVLIALTMIIVFAISVSAGRPVGPETHIELVSFDTLTKTFVYYVNADDLQHDISHTTLTTCKEAIVLACGHLDKFGEKIESGCIVGQDKSIEPNIDWGVKWDRLIKVWQAEQYWVQYQQPIYESENRSCVKFGPYSFCEDVIGPCGEPTGVTLIGTVNAIKYVWFSWFPF